MSPYAKFEVETAQSGGTDGLVHIRSCRNNKYWGFKDTSFKSTSFKGIITVSADKPEEDQSKISCTLFKLISDHDAKNIVRIMHVQQRVYFFTSTKFSYVLGIDSDFHDGMLPTFRIIDWETLVFLPRHVAFKGNNGKYLCLRQIDGHPYLQFDSGDIGDPTVTMEVFMDNDGTYVSNPLVPTSFGGAVRIGFWRILLTLAATTRIPCFDSSKRLTKGCKANCLNANVSSVTKEVQLGVELPVLESKTYDIKYDLGNSRIYDESILSVAKNFASNHTQQSETLDLKFSYTDTKTSTWMANSSLKLGEKATMEVRLPKIVEGKLELSDEIQSGIEWGETNTTATLVEVVHKVVVPPMTKMMVNMIAKYGKYNVPFTFMQKYTLRNGNTFVSKVEGGTFTGSNYCNIDILSSSI
ncbi:hypothetical protein Goari_023101 [Gossypium aridum]|uniref:Agglutinin domain-containing protein n=1 Tax=Gossypium aridum TaxID=34290 RepID=A0A7J8X2U4_GOSAI|nr:hypothetical protein [Gossypium aridum]